MAVGGAGLAEGVSLIKLGFTVFSTSELHLDCFAKLGICAINTSLERVPIFRCAEQSDYTRDMLLQLRMSFI